jgi:hypothetical protein
LNVRILCLFSAFQSCNAQQVCMTSFLISIWVHAPRCEIGARLHHGVTDIGAIWNEMCGPLSLRASNLWMCAFSVC